MTRTRETRYVALLDIERVQDEQIEMVGRRFRKRIGTGSRRDYDPRRGRISLTPAAELVDGLHDLLTRPQSPNLVKAIQNNHAWDTLEDFLNIRGHHWDSAAGVCINSARKHSMVD